MIIKLCSKKTGKPTTGTRESLDAAAEETDDDEKDHEEDDHNYYHNHNLNDDKRLQLRETRNGTS